MHMTWSLRDWGRLAQPRAPRHKPRPTKQNSQMGGRISQGRIVSPALFDCLCAKESPPLMPIKVVRHAGEVLWRVATGVNMDRAAVLQSDASLGNGRFHWRISKGKECRNCRHTFRFASFQKAAPLKTSAWTGPQLSGRVVFPYFGPRPLLTQSAVPVSRQWACWAALPLRHHPESHQSRCQSGLLGSSLAGHSQYLKCFDAKNKLSNHETCNNDNQSHRCIKCASQGNGYWLALFDLQRRTCDVLQ